MLVRPQQHMWLSDASDLDRLGTNRWVDGIPVSFLRYLPYLYSMNSLVILDRLLQKKVSYSLHLSVQIPLNGIPVPYCLSCGSCLLFFKVPPPP